MHHLGKYLPTPLFLVLFVCPFFVSLLIIILTVSDGGEEGLGTYARFSLPGILVVPIVQSDLRTRSRYHVIVMERCGVTALEESATSPAYKLHPKQTEAVLAFVRRYEVSV